MTEKYPLIMDDHNKFMLPSGYLTQPWKIPDKWKFIAGKFIYFYGPWIP
jgi:hypothetical protein